MLLSMWTQISFASADEVVILTQRMASETSQNSTFIKPPKGIMTKLNYKVKLNGSITDGELFNWSVNPQDKGVFVDNTGAIYVSGDTALSSFELTASLKSNPLSIATNTVILVDTVLYDFDNTILGNITPESEDGGNKYMQGGTSSDSYVRVTPMNFDSGFGSATVSYDVKIGSSCTTKYMWADVRNWSMYIYINTSNRIPEIPAGYGASSAKAIGGSIPVDKWTNIEFEHNFDTGKYNTKVGDVVTENLNHKKGAGYTIGAMGFSYKVDNIRIYSGHAVERRVEITNPSSLTIPHSGEIRSKLFADVFTGDLKISDEIKWELSDTYPGVSITGDVISVSPSAPSSVDVKASLKSNSNVYDVFTINLIDETKLDFSSGADNSEFTGATEIVTDSDGVSYLKTNGTSNITIDSALQSGTAIAINASIHSLNQNISSLCISDDIEFIINKSEGIIYSALNPENSAEIGEAFDFTFIYDDINKTYMAFADNVLIESGNSLGITPESFSFSTNLSYLYIGSLRGKSPYVTKKNILGTAISGKQVSADTDFISEDGSEITSSVISWYVGGDFVSSGETFTVPLDSEGKEIYYTISVSNSWGTTSNIISKKEIVKKLFEASYSSDAVNISVNNIWDMEKDVISFVSLYDGNRCTDVFARKINVGIAGSNDIISVSSAEMFEKIVVSLVDSSTYSPLTSSEVVFGNPEEKISGQIALVYVLKPKDTGDILSSFEGAFLTSDLETAINNSVDNVSQIIEDIKIVKLQEDASPDYSYTPQMAGLYKLVCVKEDGTKTENEKYVSPSKILTENGVSNLSDLRIKPILKAITLREDAEINSALDVYSSVTDKANVISLANEELKNVYASCYLVKASENQTADKNLLDALKAELSLIGVNTLPVDILMMNTNYGEVMQKTSLCGFSNIDTFLSNLKTYSILCGVKNVVNYKDAKYFLEYISSEKYNLANEDGRNQIANAIYGKSYLNLGELLSAVNSVKITNTQAPSQQGQKPENKNPQVSAGSFSGGSTASNIPAPQMPKYIFRDVADSHWAFNAILHLTEKKIINGYDGSFKPENNVTRAEFVKILCAAFGIETKDTLSFEDVEKDSWYAPYIAGAFSTGLINGDGDKFNPNENISRQDAAVMVYRFAKHKEYEFMGVGSVFNDDNLISDYAKEAVYALNSNGIINGIGNGYFEPMGNATRAQAAQIIYNMLTKGGR